jgi:hypothetical protein
MANDKNVTHIERPRDADAQRSDEARIRDDIIRDNIKDTLLQKMSDAAVNLIKAIERERQVISYGAHYGEATELRLFDEMSESRGNLVRIIKESDRGIQFASGMRASVA